MKMACWTCNRQEKSPSRLLGGDFLLSKKKDEDGLVQGSYKSDQAEDKRVSRMLCKKGNFVRMNWQF